MPDFPEDLDNWEPNIPEPLLACEHGVCSEQGMERCAGCNLLHCEDHLYRCEECRNERYCVGCSVTVMGECEACPNCGKAAFFKEHVETFTETHGMDCGPYEQWTETWLTCSGCGETTNDKEVSAVPKVSVEIYKLCKQHMGLELCEQLRESLGGGK